MARETKTQSTNNVSPITPSVSPTVAPPVVERLEPQEKQALDKAKVEKALAFERAENAALKHKLAEGNITNLVYQFALKYGLSNKDQIDEDGTIVRFNSVVNSEQK